MRNVKKATVPYSSVLAENKNTHIIKQHSDFRILQNIPFSSLITIQMETRKKIVIAAVYQLIISTLNGLTLRFICFHNTHKDTKNKDTFHPLSCSRLKKEIE